MRDVDDYEQYEILIKDQNLILGGRHFCKFGNIDYSKTHSTNWLKSFSKIWCNFHIDQNKGRFVKRRQSKNGMTHKKLCRTTLNDYRI